MLSFNGSLSYLIHLVIPRMCLCKTRHVPWTQLFADRVAQSLQFPCFPEKLFLSLSHDIHNFFLLLRGYVDQHLSIFDDFEDESTIGTAYFLEKFIRIHLFLVFPGHVGTSGDRTLGAGVH